MFSKTITYWLLFFCSLSQVFAQDEAQAQLSPDSYSIIAAPTNSNLIVTTPDHSYFKVWDLSKGLVMKEYVIQGQLSDFHSKGYGRALALILKNQRNFEIWDTEKGEIISRFITSNNANNPIEQAAIAPNMRFMAYIDTASQAVKIWDIGQKRPVLNFTKMYSWPHHLGVSPNTQWVAKLGSSSIGNIINLAEKKLKNFGDSESGCGMFHSFSFSSDSQWFAATGDEGYAELVSTQTGKPVFDLQGILNKLDFVLEIGRNICIAPGKKKVIVGDDFKLFIVDVLSKKASVLQDTALARGNLNITANSKYILSAYAGIIRAYDINTGKLYLSFLHTTEGTIVFDAAGTYWTSGKALTQVKKKEIILNLRGKKETALYPYTDENFRSYQPQAIAQKMQRLAK